MKENSKQLRKGAPLSPIPKKRETKRNVPAAWHLSDKTYELFRNEKWVRKIDEFVKHSSPKEETADELVECMGVVRTVPYKRASQR